MSGITPARAGKRTYAHSRRVLPEDHPRTRGEKFLLFNVNASCQGSPPHARGKVRLIIGIKQSLGITPARAGKSRRILPSSSKQQDHPRTRGEKILWHKWRKRKAGSPPHARGKVSHPGTKHILSRITPARAGKRLNKPPYYGHSSAAGHRISFNFPMSSYVSRQSVKALCAPRISIPKYSQSAVSVY